MDKKITYQVFDEKARCPQDIEHEHNERYILKYMNIMKDMYSVYSQIYEMM